MKNAEKFEKAFNHFKQPYKYRMGGTQTVILPNGKSKFFDDREYYSGRGAKYNSSIRHDAIGEVKVSRKAYSEFLQDLRQQEFERKFRELEERDRQERIEEARVQGVYSIIEREHGTYIELSDRERHGKFFDADRLANTLDISVNDAELLNSPGKTYVFAKQSTGRIVQLYHPALSCNDLNISISYPTPEQVAEFNHEDWVSEPYAGFVGQTANENHFVC